MLEAPTALGRFRLLGGASGIREVLWPDETPAAESPDAHALPPRHPARQVLEGGARALLRTLGGAPSPSGDALVPLDLSGRTDFRVRVWGTLRTIPRGEVRSYGEVAQAVGCRSARAVGQACGANPLPVLVPCHRVVAAGGRPGGFGHGLAWKRRLLALEGVRI